jgi:hypothetical protein
LAKAPARSITSTAFTRNRPRAAFTKFLNTVCTLPPNPARTNCSRHPPPANSPPVTKFDKIETWKI